MGTIYYQHAGIGSDSNPGTEAEPFLTLGKLKDAINLAGTGSGGYTHRNNGVANAEGNINITATYCFLEGWNGVAGDDGVAVIDATGYARAFYPSGPVGMYRNFSISGFTTNAFRGNGGSGYFLENFTIQCAPSKTGIVFQNTNDYSTLQNSEIYGASSASAMANDAVDCSYVNNYYHDCQDGDYGGSGYFRDCIFDTLTRYGVTGWVGGNFHRFRNCDFYRVGTAIYAGGGGLGDTALDPYLIVEDCIFQECNKAIDTTYLRQLRERRNCFWLNVSDGITLHATDLAVNPSFTDPLNGDFSIPASSAIARKQTGYTRSLGVLEPPGGDTYTGNFVTKLPDALAIFTQGAFRLADETPQLNRQFN